MRWLISTDGTTHAQNTARFAASLLQTEHDEVVLLGVVNRKTKIELTRALDELEELLNGSIKERILQEGSIVKVIEQVASKKSFDIAVYASRGRRGLTKILFGSVAAKLAQEMPCSVLIVRNLPQSVKKVLVASTLSEGHEAPVELAARMASTSSASLTILHVMSQITLTLDSMEDDLQLSSEQAILQGTREGKGFEHMLKTAHTQSIDAQHLIRYGLVEDEIVKEVLEGDYDLLVLGAHWLAHERNLMELLVEDVTNAVLLNTRCPVLIVRK